MEKPLRIQGWGRAGQLLPQLQSPPEHIPATTSFQHGRPCLQLIGSLGTRPSAKHSHFRLHLPEEDSSLPGRGEVSLTRHSSQSRMVPY